MSMIIISEIKRSREKRGKERAGRWVCSVCETKDLLPGECGQVERHEGAGADGDAHESAHELVQLEVLQRPAPCHMHTHHINIHHINISHTPKVAERDTADEYR